jgi:RES domain-containing protein
LSENLALGGQRPIDLLDTGIGFEDVTDVLRRIEHGECIADHGCLANLSIEEIDEAALPDNRRVYPAPAALQRLGTEWLLGQTSLVLIAPSAITLLERNILLNPAHPEIKQLRLEAGRPFHFAPRMFGK